MKPVKVIIRETLFFVGTVLVAVAAMLLLVLLAITARFLTPVVFLAAIGGLLLSCWSHRFHDWVERDRHARMGQIHAHQA